MIIRPPRKYRARRETMLNYLHKNSCNLCNCSIYKSFYQTDKTH